MSQRMSGRRSIPYPGVGAAFVLPDEIWQRSVETMRVFGEDESEALVFWGGIVVGRDVQVTGLYLPSHVHQGGRVQLTEEESRWLVRRLRERDEKLVAQAHSHPGFAYHSAGDDKRAASFHPGYLSIVAPNFGRGVGNIADCAVFEFDGADFLPLNETEVRRRIWVLPTVEERPPTLVRAPRKTWITTIVSNLRPKLIGRRRR